MATAAKKTAKKAVPKEAVKKTASKKASPKKTVNRTTAAEDKKIKIKYADKSTGQPELVPIFHRIAKLMEPFAKGSVKKSGGKDGQVGLTSFKQVEIAGRKLDELYLGGALVQKGFVGFYFFHIYVAPELKAELKPELLKTLKGKTCFHIKKDDPQIYEQISDALNKGYRFYKKKGWID